MRFRKKPVQVEAVQWFSNGDHPYDYLAPITDPTDGTLWTAEHQRKNNWEGQVVGYYRDLYDSGDRRCWTCNVTMHNHGWINTAEGGHIVCPGDYIITSVEGEVYPCKPSVFEATYEPVDAAQRLIDVDDMRIQVVKRELEQGVLSGLREVKVSDLAAALVLAALDGCDQHLAEKARVEGFEQGWNQAVNECGKDPQEHYRQGFKQGVEFERTGRD